MAFGSKGWWYGCSMKQAPSPFPALPGLATRPNHRRGAAYSLLPGGKSAPASHAHVAARCHGSAHPVESPPARGIHGQGGRVFIFARAVMVAGDIPRLWVRWAWPAADNPYLRFYHVPAADRHEASAGLFYNHPAFRVRFSLSSFWLPVYRPCSAQYGKRLARSPTFSTTLLPRACFFLLLARSATHAARVPSPSCRESCHACLCWAWAFAWWHWPSLACRRSMAFSARASSSPPVLPFAQPTAGTGADGACHDRIRGQFCLVPLLVRQDCSRQTLWRLWRRRSLCPPP